MDVLTPLVRWAQNGPKIHITVELSDVKNPDFHITETGLTFNGYGHGGQGEHLYNFSLEFYKSIDYKASSFKCNVRNVSFEIFKQVATEEWPRLLKQVQKPGWLRIDFDKWKLDESDDEKKQDSIEDQVNKITFEQRVKSEVEKAKDDIFIYAKVSWLTIYNLFQAVCFTIIFVKTVFNIVKYGGDVHLHLYDDVGDLLLTCQLGAFVEILNPLLGVVKTGVVAPLLQVGGRNFCLFILVVPEKSLHEHPIFVSLVLAWSASEVIRYPFYISTLHQYHNVVLTWLRYSAWMVLYPMGMTSEVIIMYLSTELSRHRWVYSLPNALNISFSLSHLLTLWIVAYLPLAAYMLKHMWILRCRKIGGLKRKPKVKSS